MAAGEISLVKVAFARAKMRLPPNKQRGRRPVQGWRKPQVGAQLIPSWEPYRDSQRILRFPDTACCRLRAVPARDSLRQRFAHPHPPAGQVLPVWRERLTSRVPPRQEGAVPLLLGLPIDLRPLRMDLQRRVRKVFAPGVRHRDSDAAGHSFPQACHLGRVLRFGQLFREEAEFLGVESIPLTGHGPSAAPGRLHRRRPLSGARSGCSRGPLIRPAQRETNPTESGGSSRSPGSLRRTWPVAGLTLE